MKQYCVDCSHWTMGDTWGTPQGRDHGFHIECKGWCLAKPNRRKRWNYQPATKCPLFSKRERTGLIMEGQGLPTEEQLENNSVFYRRKIRMMENITVPRWFLEVVEDTLRIQNNINLEKETGETCQDRNVRQSLNGIRKLLNDEELTGRERLEKLHPSLPSSLDEAANEFAVFYDQGTCDGVAQDCFKAGAKWIAEQIISQEGEL